MKHLFSISLLIVGFFFISSCSEKLDLNGQFKETAVVFGLLDQNDTKHFIKINRAFIGPGNSLEIAKIPDSSYFESVVATINEAGTNRSWTLKDTTIANKNPNGVFYAPEQKLYYFETSESEPLLENTNYNLSINVNNNQYVITATTQLVKELSATVVGGSGFKFGFAENPGEYISSTLQCSNGTTTVPGNAYEIHASLDFQIQERIGGQYFPKNIKWDLGTKSCTPGEKKNFQLFGEIFYNRIVEVCASSDPAVDRRLIDTMTVTFTGAGEEFSKYMLVSEPASSLAQNKPSYTNLSATNGMKPIGIFSSRQTLVIKKPFSYGAGVEYLRSLTIKSTQELCQGPITGNLFFCSNHPGDTGGTVPKPYACD